MTKVAPGQVRMDYFSYNYEIFLDTVKGIIGEKVSILNNESY